MDIDNSMPFNWVKTKLGTICTIVYGKNLPIKELKIEGYPVFGANGIIGFNSKYLYEDRQVLISCRGAYSGKINYSPAKCFITNNSLVVVIIDRNIVITKFLFYGLHIANKSKLVSGTAQPQVTINNAIEIEIPLPPLPEQHRIVAKIEELFSELDKGVEALKTAQQQLKVYRQAVLQWAFEGKLTEEWRKQQKDIPSASQLLEQIKAEREKQVKTSGKTLKPVTSTTEMELAELPTLPEGWYWVKMSEVTSGVQYGTSSKSKEKGKFVVIRMGNIQNCRIRWDDLQYTDDENEINKYLLRRNDVLFNRTNSPELVGKSTIYKGEMPAIFAGYLIRLNQLAALVNPDFLNYFLNSHIAKKHGNSVKTDGVNQSNINGTRLGSYPFPFCSLKEQNQIVQEIETRLSVADKLEETVTQSLQQAEALRQSILKRAFAGKLVPQDSNDEPAAKLLERIKAERASQAPVKRAQ